MNSGSARKVGTPRPLPTDSPSEASGQTAQIIVTQDGNVRCVYTEAVELAELGRLTIARGSHVEPDDTGRWIADLGPVGGPCLGPYPRRSDALKAEQNWLNEHWLTRTVDSV